MPRIMSTFDQERSDVRNKQEELCCVHHTNGRQFGKPNTTSSGNPTANIRYYAAEALVVEDTLFPFAVARMDIGGLY